MKVCRRRNARDYEIKKLQKHACIILNSCMQTILKYKIRHFSFVKSHTAKKIIAYVTKRE